MLTLSNLAVFFASFVLAGHAMPSVQPAPDAGTVFAVYPGWDMDNGSYMIIHNGTELACMQSCRDSESCCAFSYVPYGEGYFGPGPSCFLKNAVTLSTFKRQSSDTSVGLIGPCGTFEPVGPTPSECFTVTVPA
ncbi:hypothetical protein B0H19DRAFT_1275647 [Mycena capillaripes]|nr:hypothetical protein B0H19DRAFT_1275647 [Mycena capillaripes]